MTSSLTEWYQDWNSYKHEWIQQTKQDEFIFVRIQNAQHAQNKQDQQEQKYDDLKKEEKTEHDYVSKQKIAILVIGNCGTGKSTLIQLLSGQNIDISVDEEKETSKITIIQSKYDENIYFIDSVGLQNDDLKTSDLKLLQLMLEHVFYEGFDALKILFCISGDTKTRTDPFIDAAKFIGDLKVDNNTNNVMNVMNAWESVLIIKKEGEPDDISDFSAVIKAAMLNGASTNFENGRKHIFGFTCTDWNNFDKNNKWFKRLNEDEYEQYGYFTEESAKQTIGNKLKQLPIFPVKAPKVAILLIGNGGTGKSSLVQLLSGQSVNISSGATDGTTEISTFESKYNSNIYYIDTFGLQHSNTNWSDGKLLKEILKYVHHKQFRKIKILFCVSGDTKTRKGPYSRPAQFIGNLQVDDDNNNYNDISSVWDSVLIIKKNGDPDNILDISGVMEAAISNGATNEFKTDQHFFGFTCIDWNFDKNDKRFKRLQQNEYENYGYLNQERVKERIENKLKQMLPFELKFAKKQCTRCGTKGDPRYIEATCHTKSAMFHVQPLSRRHCGWQELEHDGELISRQQRVNMIHSGYKENKHRGKPVLQRHLGEINKMSVTRVVLGILSLSTTEWLIYDSKEWDWYECCNAYVEEAELCYSVWSCCNKDPSDLICDTAPETWSCCGQIINSKGCKELNKTVQVWSCCGKPIGDDGCQMIWTCCKKKGNGCDYIYRCCQGESDSKGCQKKCVNCKTNWGKGLGCVEAKN